MGVGKLTPAKYLTIGKESGKLRHKDGENITLYDYLEGRLEEIQLKEEEFRGSTFNRWYFHFSDNGELYILQSGESSTFSRSLLNSLAGAPDLSRPVHIAPYTKTYADHDYTVPYVEQGGEQVSWAVPPEKIPDAERVQVGDKTVLDDKDRRAFFRKVAGRLNEKLKDLPSEPPSPNPHTNESPPAASQPAGLGPGDGDQLAEDLYDDDLPF